MNILQFVRNIEKNFIKKIYLNEDSLLLTVIVNNRIILILNFKKPRIYIQFQLFLSSKKFL